MTFNKDMASDNVDKSINTNFNNTNSNTNSDNDTTVITTTTTNSQQYQENKVDTLIDILIDDFYAVSIQKNPIIDDIKRETNFVKYQEDINKIITNYIKSIPNELIENITKKGDSKKQVYDIITKYIIIYIFLTIGIFYKSRPDIFTNNIVEFTKNQSQYSLTLENFFNSESNFIIVKLFYICKNIIQVIAKEPIKIDTIQREPYADETIAFLDSLNTEIIKQSFKINNASIQSHNIIKTVIIIMLYEKMDKLVLHNIIEQSELAEGEYMFIEIVEHTDNVINLSSIESVLSRRDIKRGTATDIWNFIQDIEQKKTQTMSNDDKINTLLNARILVPILDDFLLFHKNSEKYDKQIGIEITKKKEDTKIRYIIDKIDTATGLYSKSKQNDKENIMKLFNVHLYNRKAILRNNSEEVKIVNKYSNQKRNAENNDYYNDLLFYRRYAFINFKEFESYGFSHYFTKTITAVRAVNFTTTGEFRQNKRDRLQVRVGSRYNLQYCWFYNTYKQKTNTLSSNDGYDGY